MQDYVIGVDIGGTNIKAGVVDYQGSILYRKRITTDSMLGAEMILDRIAAVVVECRDAVSDRKLKAVGFGIPGAVHHKTGVVTQAPNLKAWEGLNIQEAFQSRLKVPCFIENDANAIAAGEMWVGAGRGFDNVCCLTLGTGVGGGVIIEGELLRGADGTGAELGHIAIDVNGARCNCGSTGCLETFASATGIMRMVLEALNLGRKSSLSELPLQSITPAIVFDHAMKGDALSLEIYKRAGEGLGAGMASLINIFNPEVFIIGGGIAASWDLMMPPALEVMSRRAFKAPAQRVKIARAETEDDAGVFGNAYIAWEGLQTGSTHVSHERRFTPWGFWEVLEVGPDYKVKRIYVHPGHRLSYQKHQQREETWMIASGEAQIVLDGKDISLKAGETIHIGKTQAHRIGNSLETPLVFFEVQRGTYFGEDDITRLQDDYKRN